MSKVVVRMALVVGVWMMAGGGWAGEERKPAGDQRQVVKVKTAEEFVAAIGSDRIIQVEAAELILSDVKDRWMELVRWDKEFDGKTLTIRNVRNLSIVGVGEKPARLIARPSYVYVLNFEKCQNVELGNLVLGHAPQKGYCTSGVVGITNCTDFRIQKCDLFGCGTEGLTLENVRKLIVEDSIIRDCSYGIMNVTGCSDLGFLRCRFSANEKFWGMNFKDSKDILFTDCVVENNVADSPLLHSTSCSNIQFKGGAIRGNRASALIEGEQAITIQGTLIEKNTFEKK